MPRTDSLKITAELLSLIAEIDEFKGAWRALGRIAPERLRQLRKVATIQSVGSSTRIEGSKLSDREVEALLGRVEAESFATRDEQEVAGYALVMDTVFTSFDSIPLTENHVKQLHAMLLRYSDKDIRHRGEYKKLPNQIEAFDQTGRSLGIIFETTSPFDTPRAMEDLFAWLRRSNDEQSLHPLLITAVFIVTFLAIHPFQDGNGRLSRILTTLLLLKAGYAYVPYASLESIIEHNKDQYYRALRRTQTTMSTPTPDWEPWLNFFIKALQTQKRQLEAKVEREKLMRTKLPELSVTILNLAAEHGRVSVGDILTATGTPRGTIKKRLNELVEAGHLQRAGQGRGSYYMLI